MPNTFVVSGSNPHSRVEKDKKKDMQSAEVIKKDEVEVVDGRVEVTTSGVGMDDDDDEDDEPFFPSSFSISPFFVFSPSLPHSICPT